MVSINSSWLANWIDNLFSCMGGCFGCYTKPTPITAVDEPANGLRIQGKLVRKPSLSEDWWSTSTFDLEYCALQSQLSLSSIGTGTTNSQTEFVNHGLNVWNDNRLQWVGSGCDNRSKNQKLMLSWNITYESLLLGKRPFPQPIPLSEAIDLLVDVWDHDGLYD